MCKYTNSYRANLIYKVIGQRVINAYNKLTSGVMYKLTIQFIGRFPLWNWYIANYLAEYRIANHKKSIYLFTYENE